MNDKIRISVETIVSRDFAPALNRLASQPLPAKVSYAVARTVREIANIEADYLSARNQVIRRLGEFREGKWVVTDDNFAQFTSEINEMKKQTEELWITAPIVLPDNVNLAPLDWMTLDNIIAPPPGADVLPARRDVVPVPPPEPKLVVAEAEPSGITANAECGLGAAETKT